MKTYFALFLIATIASLVTTPLIRRLCERLKLLDVPLDGRRLHRTAIPRLGGVALYDPQCLVWKRHSQSPIPPMVTPLTGGHLIIRPQSSTSPTPIFGPVAGPGA